MGLCPHKPHRSRTCRRPRRAGCTPAAQPAASRATSPGCTGRTQRSGRLRGGACGGGGVYVRSELRSCPRGPSMHRHQRAPTFRMLNLAAMEATESPSCRMYVWQGAARTQREGERWAKGARAAVGVRGVVQEHEHGSSRRSARASTHPAPPHPSAAARARSWRPPGPPAAPAGGPA